MTHPACLLPQVAAARVAASCSRPLIAPPIGYIAADKSIWHIPNYQISAPTSKAGSVFKSEEKIPRCGVSAATEGGKSGASAACAVGGVAAVTPKKAAWRSRYPEFLCSFLPPGFWEKQTS